MACLFLFQLFCFNFCTFVQIFEMNKFTQRLKYYGLGFGIGLVFVFIFFENRGCSWLPSNRVKNSILDRVLVVSEDEQVKLDKKKISKDIIIALLNSGDVDFDQSVKEGKTKIYHISKDQYKLYFTLPKDHFISEVKVADKDVTKISNTTEGRGTLIHFPNDENLVYVDSTSKLSCQQEYLGIISQTEILKKMKKSGGIDFGQTFYFKKPRPTAMLLFDNKKVKQVRAKCIWYKNKITIKSLAYDGDSLCQ